MAWESTEMKQYSYQVQYSDPKKRSLTRLHRRQDRSDTGELLVEIAGISGAADCGDEWRRDPLVVDVIPVDVAEESMGHDFLGIGGTRTETQLRLTSQAASGESRRSHEACGWGKEARQREWHRRFHLHLHRGTEIAEEASGR